MTSIKDFNKEYAKALKQFQSSNRPLVGALLTLAKTITTAQSTLPNRDWKLFCRQNALGVFEDARSMPARLKSLLILGEAETRFRPFTDSLPASISALKDLARLTPEMLKTLTENKSIHPMMTTQDAAVLVVDTRDKTTEPKSKRVPVYSVTLDFYTAEFTVPKLRSLLKTLSGFLSKHGAEIGLCPDIRLSADADLALLTDERKRAA